MQKLLLCVSCLLMCLLFQQPAAWAVGNALRFSAYNSSYVQIARPVQSDFTIEYWVKTSMTSPTGTDWYDGAGLVDGDVGGYTNDFGTSLLNGKVAFGVGNPDVTIQSKTTITDNAWHHVAVTRSRTSGQILLYLDGVLEASGTGSTNRLDAATAMRLGGLQPGSNYFSGQLDEVRFWSVVRTQAQITASKNYLVASGTANLVAYYRLDEGSGTTAGGTGTGADGTLMSGSSSGSNPSWQVPSTAPLSAPQSSFVAKDDGLDAAQNTATAGNVILNDTNADNTTTFTVTQAAGPSHGTLTLNGTNGSYTYTPTSGYLGADSFQYQVCTGSGTSSLCSNTATVSINVYDPALVCSSATGPNLLLNPSFEQGNQSFTSAYTYVPRPAATVTASPDGLYPESTYAVGRDANYYHPSFSGAGRGGGRFMIVNGDASQSQVYSQTVTVVPNRYYTFSGYAQSVNATSPAVLGFVINGKSASVSTMLPTTVGQYQQFSGVWYSGTSQSATFEVRDINREAFGNDFGLDDLYFGTCNTNLTVNNVTNPSVSSQGGTTNIAPMQATLTNTGVSVASLVVKTLPPSGSLYLGSATGTPITAGQVIAYAQRTQLYYAPVSGSTGTNTFTYSALDSEGAGSNNTATFTIPVRAASSTTGPLPVTLTSFAVSPVGSAAHLNWQTASEQHNAYFTIERSATGQALDFVAIGQVVAQGSRTLPSAYQFSDKQAATIGQRVYYRLRQVDEDGTSTYSPVQVVSFLQASANNLHVYPNPTNGLSTSLDFRALPATATYQVYLLDATGRTTRQWTLPGGQVQVFDVATLSNGTYLLLVSGLQPDGKPLRQVLHFTKH